MIGARVGIKVGSRVGGAVGVGADPISGGSVVVGAMPAFGAAGTGASGTGALSPAWPAHSTNDIGLLFVASVLAVSDPGVPTLSVPAGFSLVASQLSVFGGGAQNVRFTIFACRATSGAMGAPTVADSYDIGFAQVSTYTGCSTSGSAVDVVDAIGAGFHNDAYDVAVTVAGATTTNVRRLAVVAFGGYSIGATSAPALTNADLANITERYDAVSDGMYITHSTGEKATAGAFGNTTTTLTGNCVMAGFGLALKP